MRRLHHDIPEPGDGLVICTACDGVGAHEYSVPPFGMDVVWRDCPVCDGFGTVEAESLVPVLVASLEELDVHLCVGGCGTRVAEAGDCCLRCWESVA